MSYTYIQAMGLGFPTVPCHAEGDGSSYDQLKPGGAVELPSKEVLDAWIAANPVSENRHITRGAFRNRFTAYEKTLTELSSADDPSGTQAERMNQAFLRTMLRDIDCASYIDLEREDTRAGVTRLETMGILQAGRALTILDAPIQAIERPSESIYL